MDSLATRVFLRYAAQQKVGHVETLVKVNAPVDTGVARLVEILNQIPGLYTTSCCEGRPGGRFSVDFHYGQSVGEAAEFMNRLYFGVPLKGSYIEATPFGRDGLEIHWRASNEDMPFVESQVQAFVEVEKQRAMSAF